MSAIKHGRTFRRNTWRQLSEETAVEWVFEPDAFVDKAAAKAWTVLVATAGPSRANLWVFDGEGALVGQARIADRAAQLLRLLGVARRRTAVDGWISLQSLVQWRAESGGYELNTQTVSKYLREARRAYGKACCGRRAPALVEMDRRGCYRLGDVRLAWSAWTPPQPSPSRRA